MPAVLAASRCERPFLGSTQFRPGGHDRGSCLPIVGNFRRRRLHIQVETRIVSESPTIQESSGSFDPMPESADSLRKGLFSEPTGRLLATGQM